MSTRQSELVLRTRRGVYGLRRLCTAYFAQREPPPFLQFFVSNLVDRTARARSYDLLDNVEAARDKAMVETFAFIRDRMPGVPWESSRWEVLEIALKRVTVEGLYAEFGVGDGQSLRFICQRVPGPVYGFDSFRGLPEDWSLGAWQGTFARPHGAPPPLPHNATVVSGYFDEILPGFVQGLGKQPVAFLHLDADLYSSTSTVLTALQDRILPSTILVFDEYFGYPGWASGGEFRAFNEFVRASGFRFEYLACNAAGGQVAVRILPGANRPSPLPVAAP
ncbi:MAG: class I SAM-dependent methyltransferase [Thermoplasmata archaeon]